MKSTRLRRLLRLIVLLQSDRYYNANELADLLHVTRRTIYRDLNMLSDAGIPYRHSDEKGGYRIDKNFVLPPMNLTLSEALSLLLLAQPAGPDNLPLRQHAQRAAFKIESVLPSHIRTHCGQTLKNMSMELGPPSSSDYSGRAFFVLQQAVRRRRQVKLTYASLYEKGIISTDIHPYHLHFWRRGWYVIGYSTLHDEKRTFKLSRITKAELLPDRFTLKKPFDIEEYLGNAWAIMPTGKTHHVRLLFAPMVAQNVAEVLWHRTQKTTRQQDGGLLYEVCVDGLDEISWWVMGYGDQVAVLAPAELRRRLLTMAQNMIQTYQGPSRDDSRRKRPPPGKTVVLNGSSSC